jgi:predicted phosphodiesterase
VRYLVLSDIHGNRLALDAVLGHARGGYDASVCCGDLVGYGAEPNEVVDWARANLAACIRGNHDKAAAGLEDLDWFNPAARQAALWTGQALTPENLEYLRALPRGPLDMQSFQIVHGSPLDEDDYLVSVTSALQLRNYLDRPVSLFGHTHLQGGFLVHRNGGRRLTKPSGAADSEVLELDSEAWYMINPGSVGQPRDGDPRAAYAVYDPDNRLVEFRRVPYDVRQAQKKILEAGLPELLAERLEVGS